jgi:hypothetical protein
MAKKARNCVRAATARPGQYAYPAAEHGPHSVRELFATGLDVVDEAERPIAPINVLSSIGVYDLKFAKGQNGPGRARKSGSGISAFGRTGRSQ